MLEEGYLSNRGSDDDDQDVDAWCFDESESDDFDEEPTVPCPYCRREIHEESPRCPYCENYISTEDSRPPAKPWWIIVGAVAALYAALRWIF